MLTPANHAAIERLGAADDTACARIAANHARFHALKALAADPTTKTTALVRLLWRVEGERAKLRFNRVRHEQKQRVGTMKQRAYADECTYHVPVEGPWVDEQVMRVAVRRDCGRSFTFVRMVDDHTAEVTDTYLIGD